MPKPKTCTKRRSGQIIVIDPQVVRWQKHRKKRMAVIERQGQKAVKASKSTQEARLRARVASLFK